MRIWQPALHHKDTVALSPQCSQEGGQIQGAKKLRSREEGIKVVPAAAHSSDCEPMFLRTEVANCYESRMQYSMILEHEISLASLIFQ